MLTPEQREARRKFIGSSDAAAIVGLSPYSNAGDVFLFKTYQTDEDKESKAIECGNYLEPGLLAYGADKLGLEIEMKPAMRIHTNGFMASSPDGVVKATGDILEAKTAGILSYRPEGWGDENTDDVPEQYLIQGQHHLAVSGPQTKVCYFPALLGGKGLMMYRVERDDELISSLENLEDKFWRDHVLKGVPPAEVPSMDVIKRIRRIPNRIVGIDSELVVNWTRTKEILKEAEGAAEIAKAAVIAALGDAEAGECSLGTVTYFEQTRKEYVAKASTFRVARLKAAKGARNAA